MQRLALVLAVGAVIAAALPSPGLYLALGTGIAAIGTGWVGYRTREASGAARLAAAGAITLGLIGVVLGAVRVIVALAAIGRLEQLIS